MGEQAGKTWIHTGLWENRPARYRYTQACEITGRKDIDTHRRVGEQAGKTSRRLTTPPIRLIHHFWCPAMLATHGVASRFSKCGARLAAKTQLVLQIHHFWCLALLATHCFAPSFSERWLPHATETTFVLHIHHFWCLAMLATHGFATRFSIIALRSFAA